MFFSLYTIEDHDSSHRIIWKYTSSALLWVISLTRKLHHDIVTPRQGAISSSSSTPSLTIKPVFDTLRSPSPRRRKLQVHFLQDCYEEKVLPRIPLTSWQRHGDSQFPDSEKCIYKEWIQQQEIGIINLAYFCFQRTRSYLQRNVNNVKKRL